ncbi:hypothetical protein ABB07_39445 (plasmid) [Streptomyces incarnatus]|uniref:Uncharacterized protein n=1 Tax=Streptomyces incarnatus TaxID=665007 RepID=A0ABN4GPZ8_9ACTN|nr:hypothetical protein ABB07_39445 [Streptomyces incarnatus]
MIGLVLSRFPEDRGSQLMDRALLVSVQIKRRQSLGDGLGEPRQAGEVDRADGTAHHHLVVPPKDQLALDVALDAQVVAVTKFVGTVLRFCHGILDQFV